MNTLFTYILKVIICSAIFYGYYLLILRNKNFHPYNRFYLLATAILSVLLPFLHISMFDVASSNDQMLALLQLLAGGSTLPTVTVGGPRTFPWQTLVMCLSLTITLVLTIIALTRIYRVYHLRKVFPKKSIGPITFINTNIKDAPFSFMKNLFWRKDIALDDAVGEQIYRHELAHITQKHSWDKLFFQALKAVFWMNPIYYLMQRELLLIHEFIADEKAIQDKDGAAFAQMLLRTQIGQFSYDPAHPVFYSSIKKRLLMITNSQKPRYSYLRRLLVLPLLFAVSFVFAIRAHRVEMAQQQKDLASMLVKGEPKVAPSANNLEEVTVVGFATNDSTVKPNENKKITFTTSTESDKQPLIIVNEDKEHPITMKQLKAISPNDIASMNVWKDSRATSKFGAIGKNGVVEVITKDYSEKYKAAHPEDAAAELTANSSSAASAGQPAGSDATGVDIKTHQKKNPLYVVDGTPVTKEQMKKIDPNQIKKIDVLKNTSAVSIYGDRAKDGVVYIVTKSFKDSTKQPDFTSAQIEPAFPGGLPSWKDYLEHHLKSEVPVKNGAPPGEYSVTVSFMVSKLGDLSEVKAINGPDPDYGTKAEAERVIRESGKWNPALQNGKVVNFREKQKIIFKVTK